MPGMDDNCSIIEGYTTGLIGRITSLEAEFYQERWQLGRRFEAVIASGFSDFFNRYETGVDAFFRVVHHKDSELCLSPPIGRRPVGTPFTRKTIQADVERARSKG